jgi:ribonuclease HI
MQMLEHVVPDNGEDSDNEIHRKIRKGIQEPIGTAEDKAFTKDESVGAAGIIFVNGKLVYQLKFKLHGHCTNYQAEQIAIFKILEELEKLQNGQDNDKRVAIYTDSKINLDLLQKI